MKRDKEKETGGRAVARSKLGTKNYKYRSQFWSRNSARSYWRIRKRRPRF